MFFVEFVIVPRWFGWDWKVKSLSGGAIEKQLVSKITEGSHVVNSEWNEKKMVIVESNRTIFAAEFVACGFVMNGVSLVDGGVSGVQFIGLQRQTWYVAKTI